MKKLALSIALAALAIANGAAQENITFAYAQKDAEVTPVGTLRTDTYDVAIALTNPSIYGMEITKIEIPIMPSQYIADGSIWLSKELKLEADGIYKINVPDVSYPIDLPNAGDEVQWIALELEQPYVIGNGGVYVGYSFTVTELDDSPATKTPIIATKGYEKGSLYLHTKRTYRNWEDRSNLLNAISMAQVSLQGNTMPPNAARLGDIPSAYVAIDAPFDAEVMVYNLGTEEIKSIDYESTAAGGIHAASITLDTPIAASFGYGSPVAFTFPAVSETGQFEATLRIKAVNGVEFDDDLATAAFNAVLFVPKHLALVEEYTGMWCGNCPRGFVAMEYMNEKYPDFIGIAYHNNDPLEMEAGDPAMADGYPFAYVDRVLGCDPYFADPAYSDFSLPIVWEKYCDEFSPASIEVQASFDEDGIVTATSTVNWALLPDDAETANYRVEYVLIADDLSDRNYVQTNYYAGKDVDMSLMEEFINGTEQMRGLHFNDVAMMASGFIGVKESIPSIAAGVATSHTYQFDTNDAYTYEGQLFPFDKDKLRVAAFILKDRGTGVVVNAAKCDVKTPTSIIATQATDAQITSTRYYDLSGRQLQHPQGLHIRVDRYSDGTTLSTLSRN